MTYTQIPEFLHGISVRPNNTQVGEKILDRKIAQLRMRRKCHMGLHHASLESTYRDAQVTASATKARLLLLCSPRVVESIDSRSDSKVPPALLV